MVYVTNRNVNLVELYPLICYSFAIRVFIGDMEGVTCEHIYSSIHTLFGAAALAWASDFAQIGMDGVWAR